MKSYYPTHVTPLDDYRLKITFDNQEIRLFDVRPYLQDPFFAPLADVTLFHKAMVNAITVTWEDEIDICPDELYQGSVLLSS